MALISTIDPAEATERLTSWLQTKLPTATGITVHDVELPRSSGLSNETVLFSAGWQLDGETVDRQFVARVAPTGPAVFRSYDILREARVMRALAEHSDVPVPEVAFDEEDASILGAPFMVMGRVGGLAAADDPPFTTAGWVMELSPEERAKMADNGLVALAEIHKADWRAAGLEELDTSGEGQTPLDVTLADWRDFGAWAAGDVPNPTVEAGFAWLDEHRPADEGPTVLSWGDARFGNLLIESDQSVSAVLDWEMVGVGAAELDLGWWLFLLRHHTEGIGVPVPEGFPTPEAVVARYEELTGHTVKDILFWEVLAAVRLSILTQRAASLLIKGGILPEGAPMLLDNPATNLLAKLADLPSPGGLLSSPMGRGN